MQTQTHRHTDTQTHRHKHTQTHRHTDTHTVLKCHLEPSVMGGNAAATPRNRRLQRACASKSGSSRASNMGSVEVNGQQVRKQRPACRARSTASRLLWED
eukprot:9452778-Alexandrium_andersonii.AAC.1